MHSNRERGEPAPCTHQFTINRGFWRTEQDGRRGERGRYRDDRRDGRGRDDRRGGRYVDPDAPRGEAPRLYVERDTDDRDHRDRYAWTY